MNSGNFLGIDLGTSELKILLMNSAGQVVNTTTSSFTVEQPHPHWSEQNPESWLVALYLACQELNKKEPQAYFQIKAVGLSGQMHGATLIDKNNKVLRPCILWNDTRSDKQCHLLKQRCETIEEITGNLVMPGFTAPKILWVQQNEPDIFKQVHKVLLPKDYVRLHLIDDYVTDLSDASGTLWIDVARRGWSDAALAASGLTQNHMPKLVEGNQISGYLSAKAATQLGLSKGIPVAGGAGDNAASAIGLGIIKPGDGFLSLGTSGVIFLATEKFSPNPTNAVHAFCHAIENSWHQMSVMLSAASCLSWVAKLTGVTQIADLLQSAEALSKEEKNTCPIFLPYLSGERTPHNDAEASGVFWGLRHNHTSAHLAYAVLEGVSFAFLDGLNALRATGNKPTQLQLVGGGAKSDFWAQLLATILNINILTYKVSSVGAALGAARLAQMTLESSDLKTIERICPPHPIEKVFYPEIDHHKNNRYSAYKKIYSQLKDLAVENP
jgi:xylulokinase